jgi:hypothetical protein
MCERRFDAEVTLEWNMAAYFRAFFEKSLVMSDLNSLLRVEASIILPEKQNCS